jgi:hypothetical protein
MIFLRETPFPMLQYLPGKNLLAAFITAELPTAAANVS